MTQKLTPQETKAILDSLFALPDKQAKPAKAKAPATKPALAAVPLPIQRSPAYYPVLSIVEIVHQDCTTCGTEHQFIRSRLIRFEQTNSKNPLHTAFEIETVVPDNLPRRVDHSYETTNVCPLCLQFSTAFDDYLAVAERPIQKELFHG